MKSIDCRGLPCPQPVLKTRNHLTERSSEPFDIIVDNAAAIENISRFLNSQNCHYTIEKESEGLNIFHVTPEKQNRTGEKERDVGEGSPEKTLIFLSSNIMGSGSHELGQGLMKNFIATLPEMGENLWRILMVNSAVKLTVEGSPVLSDLIQLEKSGISLLVCGTCLNFYNLLEQKKVGQTTNMLDIVSSLDHAKKVISL